MSPFNFQAIQTLEIGPEDEPQIDVQNGRLVLTASRDGDQIMITAPINSVLPIAAKTTVKTPRRSAQHQETGSKYAHRRGENHKLAKLTEDAVRKMRGMAADKTYMSSFPSRYAAIKEIAGVFKVHFTTVQKIIENKSWKHVK